MSSLRYLLLFNIRRFAFEQQIQCRQARVLLSTILLCGFALNSLANAELTASLEPVVLAPPSAPARLSSPASLPKMLASPQASPAQVKPVETALSDSGKKSINLAEVTFASPLEPVFEIDIPTLLHLVDDNSLDLALAKNHVTQAKWGVSESFSHLLPSGNIYNYYERYRGSDIFIGQQPFASNRDTYQTKYMASYSLNLGGRDLFDLKASWHNMSRMKKIQQLTYKQAILDLLTQYNYYLRDIAAIEVAKESVRQAQVQVRLSESRYRAGFTTKLDITQAQTLLADKQGELLQAQNQKLAVEYGLASMLRLAVGVTLKPLDSKLRPIQLVDSTITLPKLFELAVENRPDVKAMMDNINEAKSRYAATRAQLFPTVTVSGFKRHIGPQDHMKASHEIFASFSYDAARYMGLEVLSQIGQQRAKVKEAMLMKEKQLYDIQKDLSEAYLSSNLYQEQIKINEQKVKTAAESFRIARHRRMSGTGISLDVVQAQKDLSEARQEYYSSVMNYNVSQLKLLFQTGQISPQRILTALALSY